MSQKCTAKAKSTGKPCTRWAIEGGKTCPVHGSSNRRSKLAAKRVTEKAKAEKKYARELERQATKAREVEPSTALVELVHSAAGEVEYWRAEVDRVQADHPERLTMGVTRVEKGTRDRSDVDMKIIETTPHIAYVMWTEARERLAKYAAAALKAGVEERRVRLAEDQGALMAQVIRGILGDLNLTREQQERSGEIAARHLRLVAEAS